MRHGTATAVPRSLIARAVACRRDRIRRILRGKHSGFTFDASRLPRRPIGPPACAPCNLVRVPSSMPPAEPFLLRSRLHGHEVELLEHACGGRAAEKIEKPSRLLRR